MKPDRSVRWFFFKMRLADSHPLLRAIGWIIVTIVLLLIGVGLLSGFFLALDPILRKILQ